MAKELDAISDKNFRIDFHTHTAASIDSNAPVEKVFEQAKKHNLEGLVITDHDTVESIPKAKSLVSSEFLYLDGIELTTNTEDSRAVLGFRLPHVLIINIPQENIESFISPYSLISRSPLVAALEWTANFPNALVIAPHPCEFGRVDSLSFEDLRKYRQYFHAIETHNGKIPTKEKKHKKYTTRVREREAMAEALDLPRIAVSDAHRARNVGFPATVLYERPSTTQDVVDIVKVGACAPDITDYR